MSAPLTLPTPMLSELEAAYATPQRAYHNFGHVQEVLHRFAEVTAGPGWTQAVEVYLSVLYHDAVYEAGRKDNEARSADLAMERIAQWLPEQGVDTLRVAELIHLTARHGQFSPADFGEDGLSLDARHFLDCDMAILGAEPAVFDAYRSAIRWPRSLERKDDDLTTSGSVAPISTVGTRRTASAIRKRADVIAASPFGKAGYSDA